MQTQEIVLASREAFRVKFKTQLQKFLRQLGLYERARESWIYDLYWTFADGRIVKDRKREMIFYRNLLDGFHKGGLIFDVGANQGYKSSLFLKLGARVVAVEPDELNQKILKDRFLSCRLKPKPLAIISKALSDSASVMTMLIDAPGSAKNTLSAKWANTLRRDAKRFGDKLAFRKSRNVETTTIEQLEAERGSPYFIKIDVEGHELSVLRGMRRPVPYLSFEVNLPEFRTEGLECLRVLRELDRGGEFNYAE